jgi:SAM-dependent methyltransferase
MIDRVMKYYDSHSENEWNRLTEGLSAVEFSTTLYLIHKYFPNKGNIIDIGSGPGRYSIYLAQNGYNITLFDLSDALLQKAKKEFKNKDLSIPKMIIGSATDLSYFHDGSFHAALLLGPLYHLQEPIERSKCLNELYRILKNDGIAIVAYLNSWGLLKSGLNDFPEWYDSIDKAKSMLNEISVSNIEPNFTDCYWTTPEIANEELLKNGFKIISYAGAESFLSGMKSQLEKIKLENENRYKNVLSLAAELSEISQYRESTDHLLYVIKK